MSTGIELEGLEELMKKVEDLGRKGARIENQALQKAAEPILNDAKSTSAFHDQSGKLRDGLKISKVKKIGGTKYVLVGIEKGDNSKIFYGKFLEWGTSKMSARPFLQPAYESNKNQVIETIKSELIRGLGLK